MSSPTDRWNELCRRWAGWPGRPPLPTGEPLISYRQLFVAQERETEEEIIASLIVHGAPDGMEFADLFRRTDTGKFRWQTIIGQVNEDIEAEMLADALTDWDEYIAWLRNLRAGDSPAKDNPPEN